MRARDIFLPTLKETPTDAVVISHQLMLRAGMIRKLASGLYSWLPLGFRVLKKVENIVREEMNRAGAQEMLMPAVQPSELWQQSKRWHQYGPELLRFADRHGRDFCFGPTHEEVITDLVRNELRSYKQLPINFYQIQTKFRDEVRPRFGVMRAREFIMKDAYSFHSSTESLAETYQAMSDAYHRIFDRLGLDYRAVQADGGSIGDDQSQEFHVLADSGEDAIAFSNASTFSANIETTEALAPNTPRPSATQTLQKIATPHCKSIENLCDFLSIPAQQTIKTLIVEAEEEQDTPLIALILRGDHSLNEIKAEKLPYVKTPLTFADEAVIKQHLNCQVGSLGPKNLKECGILTVVDRSAEKLADFVAGANETDYHYTGMNWERDAQFDDIADIRNVLEGDASPDGLGTLEIKRGIEVGHIFQLGTKYSEKLQAKVLNQQGKSIPMVMGCYGIGVSRIVAAAIEQNHDDKGILWPEALAPFHLALVPLNMEKSETVRQFTETLYEQLADYHDVILLDDRAISPGMKFADMELIGVAHRITISDRGLKDNRVEYQSRSEQASENLQSEGCLDFIRTILNKNTD